MMSFTDLVGQAWRDYAVDGVPASGVYEPEKVTIRALGQALDTAFDDLRQILALGGVTVYKTTRALLYADLAHDAGVISAVTQDATSAYNGIYVKAGASGSGSWSQIFQFLDSAALLAGLTDYVDDQLDAEVVARDGAISAAVAVEAGTRAGADAALDARLTTTESTVGTLAVSVGARDASIARVSDGLGILSRSWRNYMADAAAGKGINAAGAEVAAVSYFASGYIEVTRTMSITRFGSPMTSGSFIPIAYYDANRIKIGSAWTSAGAATVWSMEDAPADTRYVRLCGLSNVSAYIYEPGAVETLRDTMFGLYGAPSDVAGVLSARYVNKVTGAFANSGGSFVMTDALAVTASSYIALTGGLISPTDTTQCQISFYNQVGYLGYYNPVAVGQTIRIADHFPAATYVHVTFEGASPGAVYLINPADGLDRVMDMVATGAIVDYFAPALVEAKRLNLTGGTTQSGHDYWRTTGYIPVVEGQVFYYTGRMSSALMACIAGYGASGTWASNLLTPVSNEDFLNRRVVIPPGVSTIRGCYRNDLSPFSLLSTRPAQVLQEGGDADVVFLAPDAAYGRLSPDANTAAVHLFARGIVGDRAVSVGWAPGSGDFDAFAGDEKLRVVKTVDGAATIKCRATVGSSWVDLGEFPLHLTDVSTVVSPAEALNIVVMTDSTGSQMSNGDPNAVDGNGTWINEMSRQLRGVGDQALSTNPALPAVDSGWEWGPVVAADIRAPLGLGNIYFRGTRGNGAVKHEGRGGWHPINYLQRDNTMTLKVSAPFVAGNSVTGEVSDGVTTEVVGPVAFSVDSATTLAALAAAVQAAMVTFGAGPTAVVKDADEITLAPKFSLTFSNFIVTGGASQPVVTFPGDGKFNAFWGPGVAPWGPLNSQYSIRHYIENYGFDDGSIISGVNDTGSNLIVIIALGWNDVGNDTGAGPSATYMAMLLDKIHEDYPGAEVWVVSLWAPPAHSFKGNPSSAVTKFYDPAETFREAVYEYGKAYRAICADRSDWALFVQVSHQIDPDYAFSRSTMAPNAVANDPSLLIEGTGDHVHMRRRGYAMLASVMADVLLWRKCRPTP